MYLKYDKFVPRHFTTKTKLSRREFLDFRVQWLFFFLKKKKAWFFFPTSIIRFKVSLL